MTTLPTTSGQSTCVNPANTLHSKEVTSFGQHGRADGIPPTEAEQTGTVPPLSRPATLSTYLYTAPAASNIPRPPAGSIGAIPLFPSLGGIDSPPASDGNGSGAMVGSGTVLDNTIAPEHTGGVFTNESGKTFTPHSTESSWADGGGRKPH